MTDCIDILEDTSLRVRPQQKRARERVDRILAATTTLLERDGAESINMLAIAREAGMPAATLYHYFENRTAVFVALAERTIRDVDSALSQQLALVQGHEQDWGNLLQGLYEAYRMAPGYRKILPLLRATPGLKELLDESNRRSAVVLTEALQHFHLPQARLARIALMVSEAVQCFLDMALCEDNEEEAQAYVEEMQIMVQALSVHYQKA